MCWILFGILRAFTACFYFTCCPVSAGADVRQKLIRQWAFGQRQKEQPTNYSRALLGDGNCLLEVFGILEAGFNHIENQIRTWCIAERSWTTRKMLLGFSIMHFPHGQWKCGTVQTSGLSFRPHTTCPIYRCSRLRNTQLYSKVMAKYCQSLLRNSWSCNFSDRFVQQWFNRCQIHVK